MDMGVGHLHTEHGDAHPLAGHGGLQGLCYLAGKNPQALIGSLIQIEDLVVLAVLGNHQCVAQRERADIQESIVILALGDLVGRNLPLADFGEYCSHPVLDCDVQNLEFDDSRGCLCLNGLALGVAEQGLGYGSGGGELAL